MRRFIFLLVGAGLLLGCPREQLAVWIEESSTADSLVFGLGDRYRSGPPTRRLDFFRVHPCPENRVWQAAIWDITGATPNPPSTILFGHVPEGYTEQVSAPDPILPGCYAVYTNDGIATRFEVSQTGGVIELL